MSTKEVCVACGPVPAPHAALFITNSSDVLALHFFGTPSSSPLFRFFAELGDGALSLLGRLMLFIGTTVGFIRYSDDIDSAISLRSKNLWREAARRGIPMHELILFGRHSDTFEAEYDGKKQFFQSMPLPKDINGAFHIDDKVSFKRLMREHGLPAPRGASVMTFSRAEKQLEELGTVCVKPEAGSNGRHTYPLVRTKEELEEALQSAREICLFASIEEHLEGNLCRATVVGGKLLGFLESNYPTVSGDGVSTISELVAKANAEKPAGVDDIVLTGTHEGYIRRRGYGVSDVLASGALLPLTYRAGWGQGGRNREHGLSIHQSFIPIIEKAAELTGLAVVGFDLIIPNPLQSAGSQRWGFIEANSLPWIDIHATPLYGEPVDLSGAVWDLYA